MREILFRAQDAATGDWIKGFFVRLFDDKGNVSNRIYSGYAETDLEDYYPDFWEVDPETVDQFTGLTDKNGKKIFEGDIVRAYFRSNHTQQMFRVVFGDGIFLFDNNYVKVPRYEIYEMEIIGNIHDNPELLEG